jgi:hypothetical protein
VVARAFRGLRGDNIVAAKARNQESKMYRRDSYATYITGCAFIDTTDQVATEMEAKWGCGRLRLLVPAKLTDKFDRQRYKLNQAIWHGDLAAIQLEAPRMVTAWRTLDKWATMAGAKPLSPQVWELTLADGTVAAIVPDNAHAHAVTADPTYSSGRKLAVYTLDEIGRMLDDYRAVTSAKLTFPGAEVTAVRRPIGDPLDAIVDTHPHLDAPMDDDMPVFGGA